MNPNNDTQRLHSKAMRYLRAAFHGKLARAQSPRHKFPGFRFDDKK